MAQIIGNSAAVFRGQGVQGLGTYNTAPNLRSLVSISGVAGEVVVLSAYQMMPNSREVNSAVQCSAAVSMRFSLSNPALAAHPDPAVRASADWTTAEAVTASAIQEVNNGFPFTAVEITFTNSATVTFYTR